MAVATMRPEAGPQYPAIKPGMMGMYIFLASEVMFFGSLFAMYFYLYGSHLHVAAAAAQRRQRVLRQLVPDPVRQHDRPVLQRFTCHFAADAIAHDNRRRFFILQIATIVLGFGLRGRPAVSSSSALSGAA